MLTKCSAVASLLEKLINIRNRRFRSQEKQFPFPIKLSVIMSLRLSENK